MSELYRCCLAEDPSNTGYPLWGQDGKGLTLASGTSRKNFLNNISGTSAGILYSTCSSASQKNVDQSIGMWTFDVSALTTFLTNNPTYKPISYEVNVKWSFPTGPSYCDLTKCGVYLATHSGTSYYQDYTLRSDLTVAPTSSTTITSTISNPTLSIDDLMSYAKGEVSGEQLGLVWRTYRKTQNSYSSQIYVYGVELDVVCEVASHYVKLKVNGSWVDAVPYVNVNGTWKEATPYVNVNGSWKST